MPISDKKKCQVVWPSPECPYREDVKYASHEGQRIVDGKVYCPTLLRLSLDESETWRVIRELLNQLQHGQVGEQVTLRGQLTEADPED